MTDRTSPTWRLTGWHVLAAFTLFFAAVIAVNTLLVMRAYGSFPGEVSTTPYEDGLAYDKVIDQDSAQAALGWRVAMGFEGAAVVEVTAHDRAGQPLALARVDGVLERPATIEGRQVLRFAAAGPGVYRATVAPAPGGWDLTVTLVDSQGHRFEGARRLVSP